MSYTISTLDDGHIIFYTLDSSFSIENDADSLVRETLVLLEVGPDHVVILSDSREYNMSNLSEVMGMGSMVREAEAKAMLNHPKLVKMLAITSNRVLQMTIKGINTASFGFIEIPVFGSIEEGLNAARALIYGQAQAN